MTLGTTYRFTVHCLTLFFMMTMEQARLLEPGTQPIVPTGVQNLLQCPANPLIKIVPEDRPSPDLYDTVIEFLAEISRSPLLEFSLIVC